ncbi:site-specific integrase [Thioclava sp. 'Guangxiensis']|uniref:tyrosine-type recombinase/integrase n=1 Tax=Thioclava sp. 'Guangxiensis' TaxID=3149044 RepID=UPI0038780C47
MASIAKTANGWRVQVYKRGIRKSKIFPTKQSAKDWAARTEWELENSEAVASAQPFGEIMDRYVREVSPSKRGHRWELVRLEKLQRDSLAKIRMGDLRANDLADWRDRRLTEVSAGSVRREMTLLGAVLTQAVREWGLIKESPLKDVRKPAQPKARDRLPTHEEFERLALVAGDDLSHATARAYHAFRFACETAMRAGEIVGLRREDVDLESRVCRLHMTKNGSAREVPLSSAAVELLRMLPDLDPVFGLTSQQIDVLWRKVRSKAAIEGLNFHDSRAYALTKLSRKVDVMTLAKISGHRDLSILLNTYYRETASDIARRLE